MSLITCPKCGQYISEHETICPICGAAITPGPARQDATMPASTPPIPPAAPPAYNTPQPAYNTPQPTGNPDGNAKLWIGLALALVAFAVAAFFGYQWFKEGQQRQQIEQQMRIDSIAKAQEAATQRAIEKAVDEKMKAIPKTRSTTTTTRPVTSSSSPRVIVTGHHVRLRSSPSLYEHNIITNSYGYPIYPSKGAALDYLGEYGDFYLVRFRGVTAYISKQYSYLQ